MTDISAIGPKELMLVVPLGFGTSVPFIHDCTADTPPQVPGFDLDQTELKRGWKVSHKCKHVHSKTASSILRLLCLQSLQDHKLCTSAPGLHIVINCE